ncbi:MAG: hypothetical protein IPK22_12965 [Verrucomicrobiaceae bacterium]|nr:hypothetical protein [Verrucomicrobiaceae bacterium]
MIASIRTIPHLYWSRLFRASVLIGIYLAGGIGASAQIAYGQNVIVNGSGESELGSSDGNAMIAPSGWVRTGNANLLQYGAPEFPTSSSPGPRERGASFFAGGPSNSNSSFSQTHNISSLSTSIDAAQVGFTISGYFGGWDSQSDNATMFVEFFDNASISLGSFAIGTVTAAERGNSRALLFRTLNGTVPAAARQARVTMSFQRFNGSYNDGYADDIKLWFYNLNPANQMTAEIFPAVEVQWSSVPGVSYQVQWSPDMSQWTNLGELVVASAASTRFFDRTSGAERRFYKVVRITP